MKRKIILRIIIAAFLLLVIGAGVAEQLQADIASGIVRLHIVANSDDDCDQKVKLAVRDALLEAEKEIFPEGIKKELTEAEKAKIEKMAETVLVKNGMSYRVKAEVGKWYFPTKKYENITLPAGRYDGVRVVLGAGEGKNWWCVIFPPLCTQEALSPDAAETLSRQDRALITRADVEYEIRFRILEIWDLVKEKLE